VKEGPYFYTIIGLTVNHILFFIVLGKIFILVPKEQPGQSDNKVVYESVFTNRRYWYWVPFLLVEIAGFVVVFTYSTGKMIYYNYIPIDFTVSISMLFYYLACAKDFKD